VTSVLSEHQIEPWEANEMNCNLETMAVKTYRFGDLSTEQQIRQLLNTLEFANQYLAKATAEGTLEECVIPCSKAFERVNRVLEEYGR
jgi:hypothetical protein